MSGKRLFYTEEVLDYIRNNCETKSNKLMAEEMNEIFGNHFDKEKVRAAMKRHGVKRNTSSGTELFYREKTRQTVPEEVEAYIREHHVGIPQLRMVQIIKDKFGIEYSHSYMKFHYRKMGYCSGLTGHFSADDPRVKKNRFKKGEHKSPGTEFKKGCRPHNALPVGSIVKQTEGFWAKKVAEPNVWKHLHRLIWEEANGPIPKDKILIFLDGNMDHYQLENLAMVSRAESAQMTASKYRSGNAEVTKLGLATVRLSNKVKELRK